MRLCIPVCSPDGLNSAIEPHLPAAEHILFFDTEARSFEHVALYEESSASRHDVRMDAVLCGSINRTTLRALLEQGIAVYGTSAGSVAEAIGQFERGELVAAEFPSGGCGGHAHGGCGGGCGGHGHAHQGGCNHEGSGYEGCGGCGAGAGHDDATDEGHGCGGGCHGHGAHQHHGHDDEAQHGCGCRGQAHSPEAARPKARLAIRRIAVTSQNRKNVTEHAGKCRKFWVYDIAEGAVTGKTLLELPIEQSFHEVPSGEPHPLDDIDVLITAGMGDGLRQRLGSRGIVGVVTQESDPDQAVAAFLAH